MKEIELNTHQTSRASHKKYVVQVDDEDFDFLNQWKWYAAKGLHTRYAARANYEGKKSFILMHRLIMGVTERLVFVDHRDKNGLNNQRSNLRICTPAENSRNRKALTDSGLIGVHWDVRRNKWHATVMANGKSINLGYYKSKYAAALMYNKYAKINYGEFAALNILTPEQEIEGNSEKLKTIGVHVRNTSGYRGVSKEKLRWKASIQVNNKAIYGGLYKTKEEAAKKYNEMAIIYLGDKAILNQISEDIL